MTENADPNEPADKPSLKQRLHAATGDRDAEADALLEKAPDYVDGDDAKLAVQRARGEAGHDQPELDDEIATPADAAAVHDEESTAEGR
jgi:hypothetical protein